MSLIEAAGATHGWIGVGRACCGDRGPDTAQEPPRTPPISIQTNLGPATPQGAKQTELWPTRYIGVCRVKNRAPRRASPAAGHRLISCRWIFSAAVHGPGAVRARLPHHGLRPAPGPASLRAVPPQTRAQITRPEAAPRSGRESSSVPEPADVRVGTWTGSGTVILHSGFLNPFSAVTGDCAIWPPF